MTRAEAERLGYVVETILVPSDGTPPRVACVTLKRGTTNAPWVAVSRTLPGPGLEELPSVLDGLVARINEPIPPLPPDPQPVDRLAVLEAAVADLRARIAALENGG